MRIAFVVGVFPLLSETFVLNQITGMIDRGHEVDIYALREPSTETKVHPDVEKYSLLNRTCWVPKIPENYFWRCLKGLELLFFNFYKNPIVCLRSLNFLKHGMKAASLKMLYMAIPTLDKKPYEIIHCQFGSYALESSMMHQIGAIQGKLISSFRGWDISRYLMQNGDHVYDQLLEAGDFFLAVCESFRHRLIKLGCDGRKIAVHRSGIDCSQFNFTPRYPHPNGRIQIVTTGRLVEKKGIEYSIHAVAKLSQVYSNIEYNIIGDGNLRKSFQQLIQDLDVSDTIKLLGWRHQQEVIEILNNSHIFIAPSITARDGNQEGIPNTLKEAMAMGLPVISTQHGGIPELVKDGVSGFLVPERSADAIAEKLRYLIDHPEIWIEMGKAGRAHVEAQYDMQRLNDELVEIYQKVLTQEGCAANTERGDSRDPVFFQQASP